jgi:membrane-associated phospholipid phosphatase
VSSRLRTLIWLSIAGGVGLVGLYVVFVWSPIGQRWDDRALLGGQLASPEARHMLTSALHGIRISTLGLMVVLILMIGLALRRLSTAIIVTVAFGGAILSAEILKELLPRRDLAPALNAYVDNGNIDTYPSGHATIAMGFALALVIIASPRYRPAVAAFAMLWAAAIPMAALAAGWHRPSDVLGGMALALMWLSAASAIAVARFAQAGTTPPSQRYLAWIGLAVLAMCALGLMGWVALGDPRDIPVDGGFIAFTVAEIGIAVAAVACVAVFAHVVRGLSFDQVASATGRDAMD